MNDCFLKALQREPVSRPPIWMMRQAGRYLPEYRAVRARAGSFMQLCQTPELACEVTLQPITRFGLDAAILFSDILTIPDAMGLGLSFHEGEGPRFASPIRSEEAIAALPVPDPEGELAYVMDAVRLIRHELAGRLPLIGFSGSPWTLATYMVEGGSSKQFNHIRRLRYSGAAHLHHLLEKITQAVIAYTTAQIHAGVDVIMLFDSWANLLSPEDYKEFSIPYMKKIIESLPKEHDGRTISTILFAKNGGQCLEQLAQTGCTALGVDWTIDLAEAFERVAPYPVALQGNLDPAALYGDQAVIQEQVNTLLRKVRRPGYVFNLGHGLYPDIDPEHVAFLVDCVKTSRVGVDTE